MIKIPDKDSGSLAAIVAILILVVICIQIHSIEFWRKVVGDETAVLWSITVELIVIASWLLSNLNIKKHSGKILLLAYFSTSVTVMAPMMGNIDPILSEVKRINTELSNFDERIAFKKKELEIAQRSFDSATERSKERTGWLDKIDSSETKIASLMQEIDSLMVNRPSYIDLASNIITLLITSISVIIFQLASVVLSNVLGIKLSERSRTESEEQDVSFKYFTQPKFPETEEGIRVAANTKLQATVESNSETDQLISISNQLRQYIKDHESNQSEVSKNFNIPQRDLSLLLNVQSYIDENKKGRISLPRAMRISDTIGLSF